MSKSITLCQHGCNCRSQGNLVRRLKTPKLLQHKGLLDRCKDGFDRRRLEQLCCLPADDPRFTQARRCAKLTGDRHHPFAGRSSATEAKSSLSSIARFSRTNDTSAGKLVTEQIKSALRTVSHGCLPHHDPLRHPAAAAPVAGARSRAGASGGAQTKYTASIPPVVRGAFAANTRTAGGTRCARQACRPMHGR